MTSKSDETVKVVVRVRPLSSEEERNGNQVAVEINPKQCMISLRNPKASENEPLKQFTFDAVFGPDDTQKNIYEVCAFSMVESVLSGYNGTFFAYGQTGSGKTHTMEGRTDPPSLRGIIPNSFQHIFEHVSSAPTENVQFLVRASYLEIYNEEIRDLLSKNPKNSLELKENPDTGVYVKNLTAVVVKNVTEIDHVMQTGKKNRSVGSTLMNATSSRSHSIFTIVIECMENGKIRVGKLNLVDLAGSERQSKTGATGERLTEANSINISLSALGNVISALVDGKSTHVPYRDSKLTRLLQNSLGGNAKTVMCANCGPADYNYDETLTTLRYANRAKNIKNKPKINEDPKDAMLREYQDEIKRLKEQLEATQRGMVIDENGKQVMIHNARKEIVEKIVEREVVKEVRVGISESEMEEIRKKAEEEKKLLMKQAQDDMKQLIEAQSRTVQERSELQQLLEREAEDRKKLQNQKEFLTKKMKDMEEKLIKGGSEMQSKVSEQQMKLKNAEIELRLKAEEQAKLAKELAEKEELNLQLEEHFSSLQEAVDVKTAKLKKLWAKYQAALRETKDLQEEFQTERTEFLDTIRQLTRQIKLKDLIISNFIPEEHTKNIEKRAVWNQDEDNWVIQKLDLSGNKLRASGTIRPISSNTLRRPESEYARQRKLHDTNPRYRNENIINLDLDLPEKTTQDFEGPGMVSKVDNVFGMSINGDDGDDLSFNNEINSIGNPFLQYNSNDNSNMTTFNGANTNDKSKAKSTKKSSNGKSNTSTNEKSNGASNGSSRPKSASRRRENENGNSNIRKSTNDDDYNGNDGYNANKNGYEEEYPSARGLTRK